MKNFFKLLIIVFLLLFTQLSYASSIDTYVHKSGLDLSSTVAIIVKNADNNAVLYKKNDKKLLNPASILKVITFGSSYITLGGDYKFETAVYKDSQNNIYVKLGGDTLLSQNDLNKLFSDVKTKIDVSQIKNIYIDDSIIDDIPYPQGWMEEDTWPNSRFITPYIVDNNFTQIAIKRSSLATKVDIIQNDLYKIAVINELKIGDKQDYSILKKYGENSQIITFEGTIAKDEFVKLPVLQPEINFNIKLRKAIEKNNILYENKILVKKVPLDALKIALISHSIEQVSKDILYNSDNFAAEVVFKVAAAKYINYAHSATLDDAIRMLDSIFPFKDGVEIVDGSGVSRRNFVNSDYVVNALNYLLANNDFKNLLPTANNGTMKDRLTFLEDNLKAKTGTLRGMSSIVGSLTTKNNTNVIFSIIVQNSSKRKSILANFEDNIITEIYRRY